MAGEWRSATVTELQCDGILLVEDGNHGEYRPRPDEFVDSGVAFIRAADRDSGRVLFQSAAKINERARQRITKGIGAPGDVLLSHKGTVGKVAFVRVQPSEDVLANARRETPRSEVSVCVPSIVRIPRSACHSRGRNGHGSLREPHFTAWSFGHAPSTPRTTRQGPHARHAGRQDRAEPSVETGENQHMEVQSQGLSAVSLWGSVPHNPDEY